MTIDANTRDTFLDRYKPEPLNFRLQGTTGLWNLLTDDNVLGKLSTTFRNQSQDFLNTAAFPVTYLRILWQAADPILGRVDQLEVRAVKRQGDSLSVVAHYLSAPFAGVIGQNNVMIVPFVGELPDRFPDEAFIGGYIKTISDTADPGAFVIDRATMHGGPVPPTTATPIP